jgi:hypothetical protein
MKTWRAHSCGQRRHLCRRLSFLTVGILTATAAWAQGGTPPRTSWGDPDLQGTWTSDDQRDVPFERPARFGNRRYLTDEEFAERARQVDKTQTEIIGQGIRPNSGYWASQKGVNAAAAPPYFQEFSRHAARQTSLVVDPPDGRVPPLTKEAQELRTAVNKVRDRRPESWLDRSMYDRCITRGVAGSAFPVIYGNGTQIIQAPGVVAIRYEMIHETRIIPLDGRPHAPSNLRTNMGDARGHWEGNTLVVETTNFIGGRNGVGVNGNGAAPYSDDLKLVERFTRVDAKNIQYEMTVSDPKTYTAPWTVAFPITHEDGYQIFEYACHEGNYAMHNLLSAARAEDAAEK